MLAQGLRCGMRRKYCTVSSSLCSAAVWALKIGIERRSAASAVLGRSRLGEARSASAFIGADARRIAERHNAAAACCGTPRCEVCVRGATSRAANVARPRVDVRTPKLGAVWVGGWVGAWVRGWVLGWCFRAATETTSTPCWSLRQVRPPLHKHMHMHIHGHVHVHI